MFSISLGKLPLESSIKRGFKTPFVCLFFSTCRFIWNEEDNPESTWYVSSSCRFMRLGEGGGGGRVIVLVLVLIRALSHVCRKYHALNKMSNNTRIWKLFGQVVSRMRVCLIQAVNTSMLFVHNSRRGNFRLIHDNDMSYVVTVPPIAIL